jgi:hypothetical protein
MEGSVAGAILSDFGVFAILRVRSGLPFTKLVNTGNGQVGPPSAAGLEGRPQSSISNTETPWTTSFDLSFFKGFQLGQDWNLQVFLDWRNPLNISNYNTVFLETAGIVNEQFRDAQLLTALTDTRLDGNSLINDFDIAAESPETDYNKFSLMRAEERWGNGDGIFTVEEQVRAFGQQYESTYGKNVRFDTSDQFFRLGLRVSF